MVRGGNQMKDLKNFAYEILYNRHSLVWREGMYRIAESVGFNAVFYNLCIEYLYVFGEHQFSFTYDMLKEHYAILPVMNITARLVRFIKEKIVYAIVSIYNKKNTDKKEEALDYIFLDVINVNVLYQVYSDLRILMSSDVRDKYMSQHLMNFGLCGTTSYKQIGGIFYLLPRAYNEQIYRSKISKLLFPKIWIRTNEVYAVRKPKGEHGILSIFHAPNTLDHIPKVTKTVARIYQEKMAPILASRFKDLQDDYIVDVTSALRIGDYTIVDIKIYFETYPHLHNINNSWQILRSIIESVSGKPYEKKPDKIDEEIPKSGSRVFASCDILIAIVE
jgi:hypothetical protein